jgi:lysine 6-dehydrogenase
MEFNYVVLGAGRQGVAAAYDLIRWGDASRVILADADSMVARQAAERVNVLTGVQVAESTQVDVRDSNQVKDLLAGADAMLSAVPYYFNLALTGLAVKSGVHMVDLGGHTGIVRQQHAYDAEARAAGVSIIPDCGQVPGMGTSLMVYAISLLEDATDVYMWDGGIPQKPRPPFDYLLTFNIEGLTNEYAEPAVFLRDGKIVEVEPISESELVEFPEPIGTLEAFVAGGGTSTMPWAYQGRLRTLQNLTLRYPGHHAQLRAFWDLGLWSHDPIRVDGKSVIPRQVFNALFEPKVTYPGDKDLVILRVKALGVVDGNPAQALVELIDYYDEQTGFTAMERATGWSAAIVLEMAARGQIQPGAGGVEVFVPAGLFVDELRKRSLNVTAEVYLE